MNSKAEPEPAGFFEAIADLMHFFLAIERDLVRYPAIDPKTFRADVLAVCGEEDGD